MSQEIKQLQPTAVWENFYSLTQIPRPSKHEERITAFMKSFGESLGLETIVDEVGNVIIRKPATPGHEDRVGIVLQGHLDMVPQCNSDLNFDFLTQPIDAHVDGEWVRARGTTLGADNGIGVAAAMAVLQSKTLCHGPIEALFTIDEETGMTGAIHLSPKALKGRILMNLDSETEGELYVGCAGGLDATITIPYTEEPSRKEGARISIAGLKGGHSGMDIILGRGNSIKILMRIANHLEDLDVRLVSLTGGSLRNAIPREAVATFALPDGKYAELAKRVETLAAAIRHELALVDEGLTITCEKASPSGTMLSQASHRAVVRSLLVCPNGVVRMSDAMPGLVETSSNLASVELGGGTVVGKCLLRSSVDSGKEALGEQICAAVALAGGRCELTNGYPGWNPNMESSILKTMREVYSKEYGKEPKVMAIHAGLECGILGGSYPHMDMISFGPTIMSPHSPDERVKVDTVGKFWDYLCKVLAQAPKCTGCCK